MIESGIYMTPHMINQMKTNLLNLKIPYIMRYKGKIVEKGMVHGTVFSGHATRTTFGNSLRVLLYHLFALRSIREHVTIRVSGDDALDSVLNKYLS